MIMSKLIQDAITTNICLSAENVLERMNLNFSDMDVLNDALSMINYNTYNFESNKLLLQFLLSRLFVSENVLETMNLNFSDMDVLNDAIHMINYKLYQESNPILNKITPLITLPLNSSINYGEVLSNSVLNNGLATHNNIKVDGLFSFANPNVILPLGNNLVSVIFTPNDLIIYNSVNIIVNILVISSEVPPLILPPTLSLMNGMGINIFASNPLINKSLYKLYSSNSSVAVIDVFGNLIPKSRGSFYLIITDTNGTIIYTHTYLHVSN